MDDPLPARPAEEPAAPGSKRRVNSTELFAGTAELVILHAGEEYRLRITKNGKLILTK